MSERKKKKNNISNAILKTKQIIKKLKKNEEIVMSFRKDIRNRSKDLVEAQAVIKESGELGGQIAKELGFDEFMGEDIPERLDPRENRGLSPVLKEGEVSGFVNLHNLREGADRHLTYLSTPSVLFFMTDKNRRDAADLAKQMGAINRRWGGIHEVTYKPKKNLKMPTVGDYIEVSLAAAQRRNPENRAFVDGNINIVPLREQNSPELQARRVVIGRINELKIALVNSKSRAERDKIMKEIESINRDTPTRENAVFAERLKQLRENPGKKRRVRATEVSPEVSPVSPGMESILLSNELGISPLHNAHSAWTGFLNNTSDLDRRQPSGRPDLTAMETKSILSPVSSPDPQSVEYLVQQANALNDEIAAYIELGTPTVSPLNEQDDFEEELGLLEEEHGDVADEHQVPTDVVAEVVPDLRRMEMRNPRLDPQDMQRMPRTSFVEDMRRSERRKERANAAEARMKKGGGRRTKKKGGRKRRKTRVKRRKRRKTRVKRKKRRKTRGKHKRKKRRRTRR